MSQKGRGPNIRNPDGTWVDYWRRSVEDIPEFIGWEFMLGLLEEARRTLYYPNVSPIATIENNRFALRREKQLRDEALVATAFCTGGRISEVLMLTADNFKVQEIDDETRILVDGMPLLKRYDKTEEVLEIQDERPEGDLGRLYNYSRKRDAFVRVKWITESKIAERLSIPIPLWEPLAPVLLDRIKWAKENADPDKFGGYPWLFPSSRKPKRMEDPGVQLWIEEKFGLKTRAWYSPQRAYQIVRRLGKRLDTHIWNHWMRSQRASQLVRNYEFREHELNRYFGWVSTRAGKVSMAAKYARVGVSDLWDKMLSGKKRNWQ